MHIAPAHKAFDAYEAALADFRERHVSHEGAVRIAFHTLLDALAPPRWKVIGEQTMGHIRLDGVMKDGFNLTRGYWEAKDSGDDLDEEIRKKIARGYPLSNTIFEDTRRAVLYQNKQQAMDVPLTDRKRLADLLSQFFSYEEPDIVAFGKAIEEFRTIIPDLAGGLETIIHEARGTNMAFVAAFDAFRTTCRASIDPQITDIALEEMLVQHLLTERLFRTVFNNPDFTKRNVIAAEIENVIAALASKSFSRDDFLMTLDRYYRPIEEAAAKKTTDWSEKQTFLNTVYERFFRGFSVRQADTHGIVYTPQEIVDFMVNSVEEVLQSEFGTTLSAPGVAILDPATGTGNFIVNIMRRIKNPADLKRKYAGELFANEIMLLPYYIAAMNIEHEYYEKTEEYAPFEGLCFADTLDMAQSPQLGLFSEQNTARVQREKDAPITVVIGNPPYNVGQRNENDNNKNRRYSVIDKRVAGTYAKDSRASNRNKLSDAYVKFFRWASDRLQGRDGIVCFVSNNGFLNGVAFDGFRMHMLQDFSRIYHLDLKGNARTSGERRRKEGGNIFSDSIRTGIGITILVRSSKHLSKEIYYHGVEDYWRADRKKDYLHMLESVMDVPWQKMVVDVHNNWLTAADDAGYEGFISLGTKESKSSRTIEMPTIFKAYSLGANTNRDDWMYDFNMMSLTKKAVTMIETYNAELSRWNRAGSPRDIDNFIVLDETKIKWSSRLKECLARGITTTFREEAIRRSLYRPFTRKFLYFDNVMTHRQGQFPYIFPIPVTEEQNPVIAVNAGSSNKPFHCLAVDCIPDLHLTGDSQCFPFYIYNEEGSGRRENITEWALATFRGRYGEGVTKRDIFHYVYALLHHPEYRSRYAENLKRDLPRVPLVPDAETFRAFVAAGSALAALHLGYETAEPYPLMQIIAEGATAKSMFHVEKMKLTKEKAAVIVNPHLTLAGIPPEASRYRLGNRSALEWVLDQYQVSTDARSGITSDPNRPDDPEYIVRLIGQVVAVSVATVEIVAGLPGLGESPPPVPLPAREGGLM